MLKKVPENVKSYCKLENVSASRESGERKRVKIVCKQASKKRIRPSSHRRTLRS